MKLYSQSSYGHFTINTKKKKTPNTKPTVVQSRIFPGFLLLTILVKNFDDTADEFASYICR